MVVAAVVAALVPAAGCGRPAVDVAPVTDPPSACARVLAALPSTVDGRQRRAVTAAAATTSAAWGDPPIVLRCGVPLPPGYTPTGECLVVDSIGWYAEPADGGTIFTIAGGSPRVELSVPSSVSPPADVLVDVGNAITPHVDHPTCSA